jgi:hypothetical protein
MITGAGVRRCGSFVSISRMTHKTSPGRTGRAHADGISTLTTRAAVSSTSLTGAI